MVVFCTLVKIIRKVLFRFGETLDVFLMFVSEPVCLAIVFMLWRIFINFAT